MVKHRPLSYVFPDGMSGDRYTFGIYKPLLVSSLYIADAPPGKDLPYDESPRAKFT
jgi:hypothetical protein